MATASLEPHTVRFYVRDAISGRRMLVDTGAMHSIFLPSGKDRSRKPDKTTALVATNGTPIRSYSTKSLEISILGRNYIWVFTIADVRIPLLGADFLAQNGLLVDVGHKRLLDTGTYLSLPLAGGPGAPTICTIAPHKYGNLLQEFPKVFKPELSQAAGMPPKHGIFYHITTTGPPTHAKFRQLPPGRLQEAKQAFSEMEWIGICKKASSLSLQSPTNTPCQTCRI
ncbi:uncharacterized protein LOC135222510 [Macrobrachium nipponense]|uniref:uncharacterized protein LOC135222510 n=1 Tax=Macrobrachium nipponense TaxID=159736 RepID=UPI0030C7FF8E